MLIECAASGPVQRIAKGM